MEYIIRTRVAGKLKEGILFKELVYNLGNKGSPGFKGH